MEVFDPSLYLTRRIHVNGVLRRTSASFMTNCSTLILASMHYTLIHSKVSVKEFASFLGTSGIDPHLVLGINQIASACNEHLIPGGV